MKKRFLVAFAVALIAAGSTAQAIPIQSMSATNVYTSFISNTLSMIGVGGINVEYAPGVITYAGGQFSLNTTLSSDNSSGNIARGNFTGGAFFYKDSGLNDLLRGNIVSFNLVETYDNSGMFVGEGYFTVTSGTLQVDFGTIGSMGDMVDISFSVKPKTIGNFSTNFTASSNMTVLPIPEPITIGFLSLGSLVILRKRKHS